jgi:hypothetical protein
MSFTKFVSFFVLVCVRCVSMESSVGFGEVFCVPDPTPDLMPVDAQRAASAHSLFADATPHRDSGWSGDGR